MLRCFRIVLALLCTVQLGILQSASALTPSQKIFSFWPRVASGTPPALDGTATGIGGSSYSVPFTLTLSTTHTNDVIFVACVTPFTHIATAGVSDTAGLTWTQRAGGTDPLNEYWAKSPGVLSGDTITVTLAATGNSYSCIAWGVSGANVTSPFDPNGLLPHYNASSATGITISTTNNFTFAYAIFQTSSTGVPGSGFTIIGAGASEGGNTAVAEYQRLTAPVTLLNAQINGGASSSQQIGDALTQ
jgi:hypothetical protein